MWTLLGLFAACQVQPAATSGPCEADLSCLDEDAVSPCPSCDAACQVDVLPSEDGSHVDETIDYASKPPTGGDHHRCWADFGVHTEVVPDERWVHNLEHGAVVFLHNSPDGCDAQIEALAGLAEELDAFVLMSPYPEMDWQFAVVAWEHRMLMNCLDLDAYRAFYTEHVDNGPESATSDPSAACME